MNYLAEILLTTAGVTRTPYQNYITELKKTIPAMNGNAYLGDDQMWHSYLEENSYSPSLELYWHIQYNNMFAKKVKSGLY